MTEGTEELRSFIEAALAACREVSLMVEENMDTKAYRLQGVGAGGDVSIGYDLTAENVFFRHLSAFGAISSEESGMIGSGENLIVLDPIDGSDNLTSRFPYYGSSVSFQKNGVTVAAVVCNYANADCFVRYGDEHFLTSLQKRDKYEPVTLHPYGRVGIFEKASLHPELSGTLIASGLKFRSPGAVALSLSYAHYVNYVVFFGTMRTYDLDAGLFLCRDLHCYHDHELLIVSKDREVFDRVLTIFERQS